MKATWPALFTVDPSLGKPRIYLPGTGVAASSKATSVTPLVPARYIPEGGSNRTAELRSQCHSTGIANTDTCMLLAAEVLPGRTPVATQLAVVEWQGLYPGHRNWAE